MAMKSSHATSSAIFAFALLFSQGTASAADWNSVAPYQYSDSFSGSLTTYGWLPFMDGNAGINGLGPVGVSLDPIDILEVLDFTFMASGDLRWNRFGVFGDFIYLKISDGAGTPGPLYSGASLSMETIILTGAGTYQLWESDKSWVQAIAGVRYWSFDTTLDLAAGLLPAVSASDSISWVDPLVGLRARHSIDEKVYLTGAAAIGGFGAGSDFMWDVTGGVGYRYNQHLSLSAGYRAFGVDYERSGDVIDLISHGPIFGLTINF